VRVEAAIVGGQARMAVIDEGIGILPADQARIFEPFERASALAQQNSLGLGLYLVRQIVQAHGGRIDVVSQPGAGATFEVWLPLA
jgi:two-component system sensor kinase FixL